jgi:hypothetical protein
MSLQQRLPFRYPFRRRMNNGDLWLVTIRGRSIEIIAVGGRTQRPIVQPAIRGEADARCPR